MGKNDGADALVSEGAVTVNDAVKFTGLGRSWLYEAMSAGRIAYVKVGARRLIPRRALRQLLAGGVQGGVDAGNNTAA